MIDTSDMSLKCPKNAFKRKLGCRDRHLAHHRRKTISEERDTTDYIAIMFLGVREGVYAPRDPAASGDT